MKPQLYSIVVLLLARINYAQNTENSNHTTATQLPPIPLNSTSVAKTPEDYVTSTTKAPDDHKTSAPDTTENVTSVTKAPKGNTTPVIKTSPETVASKIPTDKVTVPSEAPNSKATSAPSLAPNVSPVPTTKGFMTTTKSGGIPRATESTSISIRNQTSNPIVAGNATTQWINKVTNAVRETTNPTSTKPTDKPTENRTSTFPAPSLFAIVLLVISVLCF